MTTGPDFYDEEEVFATYMRHRQRNNSPNENLEKPILMELIGDFRDKAVLDLGCGDGQFGVELLEGGCKSYTGVEASTRMVELAQKHLEPVGGAVHQASIEDWAYPEAAFNLVTSRLALHYIENITHVLEQVHHTLQPEGRFIFSVEHPVITSCNRSSGENRIRADWIVDDYFMTGARDVNWLGSKVVKYHRTVQDYFLGLQRAGFIIEQLRESHPQREHFEDEALYQRRSRIPLFLLFAARR